MNENVEGRDIKEIESRQIEPYMKDIGKEI